MLESLILPFFEFLGIELSDSRSWAAELAKISLAWLLEDGAIKDDAWFVITYPGIMDTRKPVPVSVTTSEWSSPLKYLLP